MGFSMGVWLRDNPWDLPPCCQADDVSGMVWMVWMGWYGWDGMDGMDGMVWMGWYGWDHYLWITEHPPPCLYTPIM